jgi:hypothetical protein
MVIWFYGLYFINFYPFNHGTIQPSDHLFFLLESNCSRLIVDMATISFHHIAAK